MSLLPILLLALVALHFWLIRMIGISCRSRRRAASPSTCPNSRAMHCSSWDSPASPVVFPPHIGYPAVAGYEVTKPYWPFLWIYVVENTMGMTGMIFAPIVIFGFLFLVPLIDRPREGRPRPRLVTAFALLILVFYVGGIIYGFFAPQMSHFGMKM